MLFALFQAAAAPCDSTALQASLTEAEQAFRRNDPTGLHQARKTASNHLDCADSQASAQWFRTQALEAILDGDTRRATEAFRASIAAHPLLPLSDALADDLRVTTPFHIAQEAPISWKSGSVRSVNGVLTPLSPDTQTLGKGSGGGWMRPVGFGALVVSGGLYAAAWKSRKTYDRTAGQPAVERLPSYRATNRLTGTSLGLAIVGSGLVGITIVR